MGWTRQPGRNARDRRRPCLEMLETRQLLSTASAKPASSPSLNSDGSTNFDQIIQASAARSQYQVNGTGETVAVIDTGVNYENEALGGAIGAGNKVVAGVDFTGSPNGVLPTWQHGTGVAGLVASSDPSHLGVAPGADIVALRVFGDNNSGSFAEIASALEWVVQNHGEYNITAVNLSVSDGGNYTSNQFANSGVGQQITSTIGQLDKLNIPVVIAAGNSFDGKSQGLGFPAIVSDAISVTATDASDNLASNAQRLSSTGTGSSAVTIAAPGVGITAPSDHNSFTTEDGTSFAAPQVTGSIVLLQQMYENAYHTLPTVAQLEQLLQQGAVTVHDNVTGINVGRLDVLNSAQILNQQIVGTGTGGSPTTPSTPTPGNTATGPLTQVILNGVSIGNYSTSQLAAQYPNLFAFLKGPVTSLRVWAPAGSNLNLGPHPASLTNSATFKTAKPAVSTAKAVPTKVSATKVSATKVAATVKVHATSVTKLVTKVVTPVPHKVAAPKKTNSISSFFSSLFPFKF